MIMAVFHYAGSWPLYSEYDFPTCSTTESDILSIQWSVEEVLCLLSALQLGKASGPGGISPHMLKIQLACSIAPFITDIFNLTGEAYVSKHDEKKLFKRSTFSLSVLASTFSYTSAKIPDGVLFRYFTAFQNDLLSHGLVVESSPTLPYGEDLQLYFWLCSTGHCRIPS